MSDLHALHGETVVLTGIHKSDEPENLILKNGGVPASFPLITVRESKSEDLQFIHRLNEYDWLIFTSQNGVNYFHQKMERNHLSATQITHPKIAAVGSETERALNRIGFAVRFTPTIFSADRLIVEFPQQADPNERCLFIRGSLAKRTITDGLTNVVDEWTVYETVTDTEKAQQLREFLKGKRNCTITFSSPSAVEVFVMDVLPYLSIENYTIAAIGHVTEEALLKAGLPVHVKPDHYTMRSMIEKIVQMKGDSK